MFLNREEAGKLLAERLLKYSDHKDTIIIAIPRGGVPVGYAVAKKLHLPLDIVLSKKIGHPYNKEYAIGAVTLKNKILSDTAYEVSEDYIEYETEHIWDILKQRHKLYYGDKRPLILKDKIVILVDDGVATGNTLISCVQLINLQEPSQIVVALPVAPRSALKRIKELSIVNAVVCLGQPLGFQAVGQYYEDFGQTTDQEVMQLLKKANETYSLDQFN
ncbi:MAG: phosphoribosyltransferase family protein [Aureibaculum sp.]|nr:phosphoribosyltransferase family protein [Aureibaculum sp.]